MANKEIIALKLDLLKIKPDQDYGELWNHLGKIELKMVEKHEE